VADPFDSEMFYRRNDARSEVPCPGVGKDREGIVRSLLDQAAWCNALGSPLYAWLLERAAEDAREGGPVWAVLGDRRSSGVADPLRLLGSIHRLVLEGRAPKLARFYPSAGGTADDGDPWPAFRSVLEEQGDAVRRGLQRPVQTNEVGRSVALLGGFLLVARETGRPLALAEIGASAGLNLRWDHYRYESGGEGFGDPASPVRFEDPFLRAHPPFDVSVEVVERKGCDLEPVDPVSDEGRLTLLSYVWPDQVARLGRLRGALEIASRVPASVDRADAVEWVRAVLRSRRPGVATVVFHTVVEMYLPVSTRTALRETIHTAGRAATPDAPVAWLKMEHKAGTKPDPSGPAGIGPRNVHLTLWPGGEERAIATAGPHGMPVDWHRPERDQPPSI
jgi:hypothetical protein